MLMRRGSLSVGNSSQASLQCEVEHIHLILQRGKLGWKRQETEGGGEKLSLLS